LPVEYGIVGLGRQRRLRQTAAGDVKRGVINALARSAGRRRRADPYVHFIGRTAARDAAKQQQRRSEQDGAGVKRGEIEMHGMIFLSKVLRNACRADLSSTGSHGG
jgi:hypothetical protein